MSLTPRLTLIGLYNYNHSVFSNLNLPSSVDEDIFVDSLLMEYGECPLIYPNYDYMVLAIGAWSRKWYDNIEKIASAINEEYNPLYNYDRTETWTENESGTKDYTKGTTGNSELQEGENTTLQEDENTELEENENGNDENLVSAYNEDDYQPSNKNVYERDRTSTIDRSKSGTVNRNKTNTIENSEDETFNETNGRQNTKTGRTYGNIGTTQNQEMLTNEIELRKTQNLYHIISELFYREFCVYVF